MVQCLYACARYFECILFVCMYHMKNAVFLRVVRLQMIITTIGTSIWLVEKENSIVLSIVLKLLFTHNGRLSSATGGHFEFLSVCPARWRHQIKCHDQKKFFFFPKNYFLMTRLKTNCRRVPNPTTWTRAHVRNICQHNTTFVNLDYGPNITLIYHLILVILGKFLILICHQRQCPHPTTPKLRNVRFSTKIATATKFGATNPKM